MADFNTDFEYMYVVGSDGTLANTATLGIKVSISAPGATLDVHSPFDVTGTDGAFDGHYTFVSRAVGGGGEPGFIGKDANGHSFFFSDAVATSAGQALTLDPGSVPICFLTGTRIETPEGKVAIETLAIGDRVVTIDGRVAPVRWVGRQTVVRTFADSTHLPICIRADALADNVPSRDLFVSPNHALLVEGVLVQAGCLLNGSSIVKMVDVPPRFTYLHVELAEHALILAENTPAETFLDAVDRSRFDNWAEHEALDGPGEMMAEMAIPRAKARRQVPPALRERLERRAATLTMRDDQQAA